MSISPFKFILKQLYKVLLNLPYLIANLFPRRKDLWLFGAWYGNKFSDNPKYLFLYSIKQPNISAVWLTKDVKIFENMKKQGLPVAYSVSIKGLWLQLRCGLVVFTHTVQTEFNAHLIASKVFRVQTWHGIPLKKIGYNDEKSKHTLARQKKIQRLFPYRIDRYDLILAAGKEDSKIFQSAFNTEKDKVVITGYPRNDIFFQTTTDNCEIIRRKNSKKLKHIIYAPTFRGRFGSEFPLLAEAGFNYLDYDKKLMQSDVILVIKLHPAQQLSQIDAEQIQECSNIKLADEFSDIYVYLSVCDALITDYSSIYFDFLLTGKPIYMAPFDIESYLSNDRSMYYDYSEVCPSQIYMNWDELIYDITHNNFDYSKYNALKGRFHVHIDGNSSKRSFEELKFLFDK